MGKCPNCHHEFTQEKRTSQQNKALHLFFTWIAGMFNEVGSTYTNLMGIETIWSPIMVKELIWKPLQKQLYDTDSTTKLNTEQINIISDSIILHFSEVGYTLEFPSMQQFLNKIDKIKYVNNC